MQTHLRALNPASVFRRQDRSLHGHLTGEYTTDPGQGRKGGLRAAREFLVALDSKEGGGVGAQKVHRTGPE